MDMMSFFDPTPAHIRRAFASFAPLSALLRSRERVDSTSLVKGLECHELGHRLLYRLGSARLQPLFTSLRQKKASQRDVHGARHGVHSTSADINLTSSFIVNYRSTVLHFDARAFCGIFARDGSTFCVATQDSRLRLYDTHSLTARPCKEILARHVSWAVLDVDYSPDNRFVIYSTWSPFVQLCNVGGEFELHEPLEVSEQDEHDRTSFFSVKFSADNRFILAGGNEANLYLFDIERKERRFSAAGHTNDINTVAFVDERGDIMLTGSDDRTIRIWDARVGSARLLGDSGGESSHQVKPVQSLLGHQQGITHVESAGDGRLVCSNGKDHCIKLWDLRKTSTIQEAQQVARSDRRLPTDVDCSIATLTGHRVQDTLIRCHFSPARTGQRYIYTGDAQGDCVIYDVLTGEIVQRLVGHQGAIRECSWHPYEPLLITASWDHSLSKWEWIPEHELNQVEQPMGIQRHRLSSWMQRSLPTGMHLDDDEEDPDFGDEDTEEDMHDVEEEDAEEDMNYEEGEESSNDYYQHLS